MTRVFGNVHLGLHRHRDREVRRLAALRPRRLRHALRRRVAATSCGFASTTTNAASCCNVARRGRHGARLAARRPRDLRRDPHPGRQDTAYPSPKAPTRKPRCAASSGWCAFPDPTAWPRRSSPAPGPARRRWTCSAAAASSPGAAGMGHVAITVTRSRSRCAATTTPCSTPAVRLHRRDDQRPQVQDPVPAGQRAAPLRGDRRGRTGCRSTRFAPACSTSTSKSPISTT